MAEANRRAAARKAALSRAQQAPMPNEAVADEPEAPPQRPVAGQETPSTPVGGSRAVSANISARRAALRPTAGAASGGALARPSEDLTRQLDTSDLIVPKIRISQAMSKTNTIFAQSRGKEGVNMGDWYHTGNSKSLGQTIYFIPVDMRKSRAMFVQGQGLVCRSFDLLQGEGDPGILCEGTNEERYTLPKDERGCAYRLWDRTPAGNVPPPCGVSYNYPGLVIVDIDNPGESEILQGIMQLRSSATQAAKAINTGVVSQGGGVWHNIIFEIGVEPKTNLKGTFFVPVAEVFDLTTAPEYERVHRRAEMFARSMGTKDMRTSLEQDGDDAF